ncbi:hypothetical protein ES288_A08G093500v1 [Gossypium darwinii]|uniref:Uncharacterized protein n=2 Tax=Gossypium TaxID=3633 RepID=A0A5D2PFA2_GOSTO|nr:hypothetical protein ES288_A08G093500v1 [Gossypium darwinii]TYI13944.1 hypothetical protein ES332_A08G094100v1 [Gossypium tomentosum]
MVGLRLVRIGASWSVGTDLLSMVKIGGLLVKIGGLKFSRMIGLIMLPRVGHLQHIKIMVLIYLPNMVTGRMILMAQISILYLMSVILVLAVIFLVHNLVVILWAIRMVGRLLDRMGLVGQSGPVRMMIMFCLGPLLIV